MRVSRMNRRQEGLIAGTVIEGGSQACRLVLNPFPSVSVNADSISLPMQVIQRGADSLPDVALPFVPPTDVVDAVPASMMQMGATKQVMW
jgi:hypothetical protein